jgi:DNA-binding MarR family transcriptional regulator
MGLSQAKWRTLMHLSLAGDALTQAEIAARLGVEEPTVVTFDPSAGTGILDHTKEFAA